MLSGLFPFKAITSLPGGCPGRFLPRPSGLPVQSTGPDCPDSQASGARRSHTGFYLACTAAGYRPEIDRKFQRPSLRCPCLGIGWYHPFLYLPSCFLCCFVRRGRIISRSKKNCNTAKFQPKIKAMQHCWNQVFCVKIHLLPSGVIWCHPVSCSIPECQGLPRVFRGTLACFMDR